jgi:1-acyl-sn-glycerol-3-phosphate acyltransferase
MLRAVFACVVFVVTTLGLGLPAFLVSLLRPRSDITMKAGRLWSRALLWAVGARVEYVGLEHARSRLPCIFIANHQSSVDIWALVSVLPAPTRFVAKQSLFRLPVLGWAMAAGGFISIDRADRARAIRSLHIAAERVRSGRPVILFAEGTRSRDGTLRPFKKGPFHLALAARVPVVPVAISGSWEVLRPGTARLRPGPVRVEFLPPLDVTGFLPSDHEGLLREVHGRLERALRAAPDPSRSGPEE